MRRLRRLMLLVVATGSLVWLYTWTQRPAAADLSAASPAAAAAKTTDVPAGADQAWQTRYFTSVIPAGLSVRSSDEDSSRPVQASYDLLGPAGNGQSDEIAVSSGLLQGSLDELPAAKLRSLRSDQYRSARRDWAPSGAIVYEAVDSYETAVFWQQGGRYATVVASGSVTRRDQQEAGLRRVLTNWQWR